MLHDFFRKFATGVSILLGSPIAFVSATVVLGAWLCAGPFFNFSDTWQLAINTVTTIITFLMVFLIQNTQNRDTKAIHLKLDELLRSGKDARNSLIEVESLSDKELELLHAEFEALHDKAEKELHKRRL